MKLMMKFACKQSREENSYLGWLKIENVVYKEYLRVVESEKREIGAECVMFECGGALENDLWYLYFLPRVRVVHPH